MRNAVWALVVVLIGCAILNATGTDKQLMNTLHKRFSNDETTIASNDNSTAQASSPVTHKTFTDLFVSKAEAKPPKVPTFTYAWSIYVGWMPYYLMDAQNIIDKWATRYGIQINTVQMDYIPSIEAFVAKKVDAVVLTNMDQLAMPASSGVDATVVVVGDYSNGNDGIMTRDNIGVKSFWDLKGKEVYLVQLSVSHYLLNRALQMNGMQENDVVYVNTSDSDIGPVFVSTASQKACVTWNPIKMNVLQTPGISCIFDSSKIPFEILDNLAIRTDVLETEAGQRFAMAMTGAWYEIMSTLQKKNSPEAKQIKAIMADKAGCTVAEFEKQLDTTFLFWTPASTVEFMESAKLKETMNYVRQFCFDHGMYGLGAKSVDDIGIKYPDGKVQGNVNNVKMRYDTRFVKMAAEGKITLK